MEITTEIVHDFSQFTARNLLNEFRLMYQLPEKSPSGQPMLYLEGPEEYYPSTVNISDPEFGMSILFSPETIRPSLSRQS
jgi:hypothetical protein